MPNEDADSQAGDRSKINLEEEWEVAYWTRKLGLTKEQLQAIINEAGPIVYDVLKKIDS